MFTFQRFVRQVTRVGVELLRKEELICPGCGQRICKELATVHAGNCDFLRDIAAAEVYRREAH